MSLSSTVAGRDSPSQPLLQLGCSYSQIPHPWPWASFWWAEVGTMWNPRWGVLWELHPGSGASSSRGFRDGVQSHTVTQVVQAPGSESRGVPWSSSWGSSLGAFGCVSWLSCFSVSHGDCLITKYPLLNSISTQSSQRWFLLLTTLILDFRMGACQSGERRRWEKHFC